MIYALLKAAVFKPRLLAAHLHNYGEFIRSEMHGTARQWAVKAVAFAVFGIGMLAFLILGGVAAMIGVMQGQYHWVLLAVPALPLGLALVALLIALRRTAGSGVHNIKQQLAADIQALNGPAGKNHEH
ncbi:MAG: hypothetical protein Q4A28_02210 [Brachymonas sp.]|nr:hypothetical protein [Brachymonas sp.]